MADKLTNHRIQLQEYGPSVFVDERRLDLNALESANQFWSRTLGLREQPLVVKRSSFSQIELRARAVTGVVRIGNTDIEISPKFLPADRSGWQYVLWQILTAVSGGLIDQNLTPGSEISSVSVPDLLADMFITSFYKGAARGLPRSYSTTQSAGPVLKGSIDISRISEIIQNPGNIPYLADQLSEDTSLARLLRWSAETLSSTVTHEGRAWQLREISGNLSHVGVRPPKVIDARRIKLGVQHKALQTALYVGILLLEGAGVHHIHGSQMLNGFLWNSDVVYERYVFWLCKQAALQQGQVVTKDRVKFGRLLSASGPLLETTPDVVFRDRSGRPVAVADAKYKQMGIRPKAADTYQVLTAGHVLGCSRVSLTYPVADQRGPVRWSVSSALGGTPIELTALPLNLMALTERYGQSILISTIADWLDTPIYSI